MITAVLADDEKLIRAGLKKILLENLDIPIEILEAKNGEEALSLCREKHPALLITDIRMPIMDGVELMKNLSQDKVKPAIIVLSGYDDFSYAKAAIQSGALSYILKPVDKKELLTAVNSAIMNTTREEKEKNEQKLRRIFEEGRMDEKESLPEITMKNGLRCISIFGTAATAQLEKVMGAQKFYVLEETKNYVCFLYPFEGIEVAYQSELLDSYIVGVSKAADDYSMLRALRKQAITAAMQSFFETASADPLTVNAPSYEPTPQESTAHAISPKKHGGIYFYESENYASDFSDIDEKYEKMISCCDIAESAEVLANLDSVFDCFEDDAKINSEKLFYLYNKITKNMFTRFPGHTDSDVYLHIKSIMIENLFEHTSLADWKNSIRDYVIYLATLLKQDTKESPYIKEAIAYMKTHFKKNINMAMVANQVSVNYTWFSEKFKEHTGVNFNEYLKRMRIDEAKKLLEKGCFKVYEVAERTGFSDVKYFMKVFKEETGMSPTEWSTKHKKIEIEDDE